MLSKQRIFIFWISLMFVITFTCSLVYLAIQQSIRMGANEIPAQFTAETLIKLENGQSAESSVPAEKTDVLKSLNAFVMVYDKNKNLIGTSGITGSEKISYPKSALDYLEKNGESRVTWQPKSGLRFATVAIKYDNGYIVAARSLLETENLIGIIGKLVIAAWLSCIAFSVFALCIIYIFINKVYKNKKL